MTAFQLFRSVLYNVFLLILFRTTNHYIENYFSHIIIPIIFWRPFFISIIVVKKFYSCLQLSGNLLLYGNVEHIADIADEDEDLHQIYTKLKHELILLSISSQFLISVLLDILFGSYVSFVANIVLIMMFIRGLADLQFNLTKKMLCLFVELGKFLASFDIKFCYIFSFLTTGINFFVGLVLWQIS